MGTVEKSKVSMFMTDYESCAGVPNILPLKCQTSRVWYMFIREFVFTHYTKPLSYLVLLDRFQCTHVFITLKKKWKRKWKRRSDWIKRAGCARFELPPGFPRLPRFGFRWRQRGRNSRNYEGPLNNSNIRTLLNRIPRKLC